MCDEANARNIPVCRSCGEQLIKPPKRDPLREPVARDYDDRLERRESELAALGGGQRARWVEVHGGSARVHQKFGGQPCLRLRYSTSLGLVSDFLAFEHVSHGARWWAGRRWRELSRNSWMPVPLSAEEALLRVQRGELRRPARLLVERDGNWWRIKSTEFEPEAVA
jgi:hypothetical protein